jgi:hypothetical protein
MPTKKSTPDKPKLSLYKVYFDSLYEKNHTLVMEGTSQDNAKVQLEKLFSLTPFLRVILKGKQEAFLCTLDLKVTKAVAYK